MPEQPRSEDSPHPADAITVQRLTVRRGGRPVLHDLSVRIAAGRITGLLGPSGSGKSTLLRALVGIQQVAGGDISVLGRPAGDRQLRSQVAYASQDMSTYRDLTVQQNLRYFARILGVPSAQVYRRLEQVGLLPYARREVGTLSGGQRSRVSLAIALLGDPDVLVLDEPTVGLDPVLRAELWELFAELAAAGTTLLVSSHVMDEAMRCDQLVLLRDGRVLAQCSPAELLERTGTSDADAAFLALIRAEDQR